ncbi:MAG: hypothetical protein LVQ96_06995 [Thermoplasmatales archaeon]|nr:hypothetical protein [Thermoplasmatales archaeon]MCW6170901.1 hypothetical protein [Thermoplasmatales archaeon]
MRYTQRDYFTKKQSDDELSREIVSFFAEEGFRTHEYKSVHGNIVQATKGGIYRTILGRDKAYTIVISENGLSLTIRLGVSPWIESPDDSNTESFFQKPQLAFNEIPEALWTYHLEHALWHFIETQSNVD